MRGRISLFLTLLKQGFDPNQIYRRMMVQSALRGHEQVLDVGCGQSMDLRWFGLEKTTGIEAYRPSYELAVSKKTHGELVFGDVRELDKYFKPGQFEACISVDVIEHVTKEEGLKMMRDMEQIARERIVIITPNGWMNQEHTEEGDLQKHYSAWDAKEMQSYGYEVFGMLGPKSLRAESHDLKYRPKALWGMVSLGAQILWGKQDPVNASSILCIKTKKPA